MTAPITLERRKGFTPKQRAAVLKAAEHICHYCKGLIQEGQAWEVEHITPLAMGGTNHPDNLAPIHQKPCHREKTRKDVGEIARAVRLHEKHTGARTRKGTMPGSRNSRFKRRIDGRTEIRS